MILSERVHVSSRARAVRQERAFTENAEALSRSLLRSETTLCHPPRSRACFPGGNSAVDICMVEK